MFPCRNASRVIEDVSTMIGSVRRPTLLHWALDRKFPLGMTRRDGGTTVGFILCRLDISVPEDDGVDRLMILCRCRIVAHEGYDFVAYNRRVALDVFRYNGSPAVGFSQDCRGFTLCRFLRYLALCAAVVSGS